MTKQELKRAMSGLDVCVMVSGTEEWIFTTQREILRLADKVEMTPVMKMAGVLYLAPAEQWS